MVLLAVAEISVLAAAFVARGRKVARSTLTLTGAASTVSHRVPSHCGATVSSQQSLSFQFPDDSLHHQTISIANFCVFKGRYSCTPDDTFKVERLLMQHSLRI